MDIWWLSAANCMYHAHYTCIFPGTVPMSVIFWMSHKIANEHFTTSYTYIIICKCGTTCLISNCLECKPIQCLDILWWELRWSWKTKSSKDSDYSVACIVVVNLRAHITNQLQYVAICSVMTLCVCRNFWVSLLKSAIMLCVDLVPDKSQKFEGICRKQPHSRVMAWNTSKKAKMLITLTYPWTIIKWSTRGYWVIINNHCSQI